MPESEAGACNVVELQELRLTGAPAGYKTASAAAQGRLSVTAGVPWFRWPVRTGSQRALMPLSTMLASAVTLRCSARPTGLVITATSGHPSPVLLAFPGGQMQGLAAEGIAWPGDSRRAYCGPQAAAQLRAALQEGRQLVMELARYLAPAEPQALSDPVFEAYRGAGAVEVRGRRWRGGGASWTARVATEG